MGVIVGGIDPDPVAPGRGSRSFTIFVVAGAAALALMLGTYAGAPSSPQGETAASLDHALVTDSGRWLPVSRSSVAPFDGHRLGSAYVVATVDGIASIDAHGTTTLTSLPGAELLQGLTSDGETAIAFGTDERGPALWTSVDAREWTRIRLPWPGTVQAVAMGDAGLVVLGIDRSTGHRVTARSSGLPGAPWRIEETDGPDSVLISTGAEIIGRGRLDPDGQVGYLRTSDGVDWRPFAEVIVNNVGEVAAITDEDGVAGLRIPGEARFIRPPEWPVSALWRVQDRIWVQTPTAAWWSRDGARWSRMPLDRAHGIEHGSPILLPFPDRALVSVGGARGAPRDLYMWILGA